MFSFSFLEAPGSSQCSRAGSALRQPFLLCRPQGLRQGGQLLGAQSVQGPSAKRCPCPPPSPAPPPRPSAFLPLRTPPVHSPLCRRNRARRDRMAFLRLFHHDRFRTITRGLDSGAPGGRVAACVHGVGVGGDPGSFCSLACQGQRSDLGSPHSRQRAPWWPEVEISADGSQPPAEQRTENKNFFKRRKKRSLVEPVRGR